VEGRIARRIQTGAKGPGSLTPNAGAKKIIASARRAAWLLVREAENLAAEEKTFVEHLVEMSPEIAEAQILAQEFSRILKQRDHGAFSSWMERVTQSRISEMKNFALSLCH
jgi:transposase